MDERSVRLMGTLIVSIDAELGWGFHDRSNPPADRLEAARSGWRWLLGALEAHDVPATWGIVGHLMLEACDGVHADHPSIEGWFDRDRSDWLDRPERRVAPELVARIRDSPVDHDIGCHTFSHVPFDDPRVTRTIARAELERSIAIARSAGIELSTMIFPRNGVGHRDLLAAVGFECYRGAPSRPAGRLRRSVEKLRATARPPAELHTPRIDEYGLVDIPPSLYLFGFEGWPRRLAAAAGVDPVVRRASAGIDRAAREDGVFHVWLHPNNLRSARDADRVRAILDYAADRREQTPLSIETMASVAARTREAAAHAERTDRAVPMTSRTNGRGSSRLR